MGFLKKITDGYLGINNEKERGVPKSGALRACHRIWNHFGKLAGINIIFLLCCIPVITIPAALSGLDRYLMKLYRDGFGFGVTDFFREMKEDFGKSLLVGLPVFGLLFYGVYLTGMAGAFEQDAKGGMIQIIAYIVLSLGGLYGGYCFVMLATLALPVRHILKNGLLLMICEWKSSVCIVLTEGISFLLVMLLSVYSLPVILFGGFAVRQLFIVSFVFPSVEKRIIRPYEEQEEKRAQENR